MFVLLRNTLLRLHYAQLRLRSVKVRRIRKLTSDFRRWRYVPTVYEQTTHVLYDAAAHASYHAGAGYIPRECIIRPRTGFGFQFFRLSYEVTYDV